MLITSGANVAQRNKHGWTPLHRAAMTNRAAAARLLCEAGVDVIAADAHGRTALHHACCFSSLDVVRQLCQYGAQPDLEDASGLRSWSARLTCSILISSLCFIQPNRASFLASASS